MLELHKIIKDYETPSITVHALRGVTINFREREFAAILGPSGCGKTTLLNIIGGLDRYTSGDMKIGDASTKDFSEEMWDAYRNATIGFVFQSYNLIPHLSVIENVELALSLAGIDKVKRLEMAQEALETVGLGDQGKKKPSQLSGGQMQRAAIARALVNKPQIVLADEPTGALDSELSEQVMGILSEIAEKTLVIMVTHNDELAKRYCNRIIKIKDGNVESDSNPYEIEEQVKEDNAAAYIAEKDKEDVAAAEMPLDLDEQGLSAGKRLSNRLRKRRMEAKMLLDAKSAELLHKLNIRKKGEGAPFKGTSMKFKTAIGLSYKNLTTKKKRTFLTAFAGSIGIIGLSLVLALANGFNAYIDGLQTSILAAVPIGVYEYNVDYSVMTDLFESFDATAAAGSFPDGDSVVLSSSAKSSGMMGELMGTVLNSVSKNDVSEEYVEYLKKMNPEWCAAINYCYGTRMNLLTEKINDDGVKEIADISPETVTTNAIAIATNVLGDNGQEPENWHQLVGDSEFMLKYYDVLAGRYPQNMNEIVLTVNPNNEVDYLALSNFGVEVFNREENGKVILNENGAKYFRTDLKFSEILQKEFKLVQNDHYYQENDGIYSKPSGEKLADIYNNPDCLTLKVVGVIRVKPDSPISVVGSNFCYTKELAEYVLKNANQSQIATAQRKLLDEGSETTVFGKPLPEDKYLAGNIVGFVMNSLSRTAFLKEIGVQMTPSYINIYPKNFDTKAELVEYLNAWNEGKADGGTVNYFDVTEMFIYNMRTIVDLMTYVLVFVSAISLVVSSIMIGVITGNSVIERTREIGILRSIGARKRDIMRVFNAETGIIGFVSGALGIGVAYALTPLGSFFLKKLAGIPNLMVLNPLHALGLVGLSLVLTLISGLIPARNAAAKNVVEALRIE